MHLERGDQTAFPTFGFVTIIRDTFGGPGRVRGVVQSYSTHDLSGVAEVVDF